MSRSSRDSRRISRTSRSVQMVFDVALASEALPLVRRIVADIAEYKRRLTQAQTERRRIQLSREERSNSRRRFSLDDSIRELRSELRNVIDELHHVGAMLLDPVSGEVGFPTIVNGSLAYLVYRAEEDKIAHWRYRDQAKLRPLPAHWLSTPSISRLEEEEGLLV